MQAAEIAEKGVFVVGMGKFVKLGVTIDYVPLAAGFVQLIQKSLLDLVLGPLLAPALHLVVTTQTFLKS